MFWGVKIKIIFIETDFLLSKKFVMPNNEKICCSYSNSSNFLWLYANSSFTWECHCFQSRWMSWKSVPCSLLLLHPPTPFSQSSPCSFILLICPAPLSCCFLLLFSLALNGLLQVHWVGLNNILSVFHCESSADPKSVTFLPTLGKHEGRYPASCSAIYLHHHR